MNFFENAIPDEIMSWHDYYQGIIADKENEIKQLKLDLESKLTWIEALRQQLHTKETIHGKQKGNPASTTGTDRQDGEKTGFDLGFTENKFNSRCSRCGGKQ